MFYNLKYIVHQYSDNFYLLIAAGIYFWTKLTTIIASPTQRKGLLWTVLIFRSMLFRAVTGQLRSAIFLEEGSKTKLMNKGITTFGS